VEEFWRRSSVSETVVAGVEVRSPIKDSIAAIGGVREGSEARRLWYLATISNGTDDDCKL
jgi:hypothetical protein